MTYFPTGPKRQYKPKPVDADDDQVLTHTELNMIGNDIEAIQDGTVTIFGERLDETFATNIDLDCSTRDNFKLDLITGPITLTASNFTPGQCITVITKMDAIGGYAITLDPAVFVPKDNVIAFDNTANAENEIVFTVNYAGNQLYYFISKIV